MGGRLRTWRRQRTTFRLPTTSPSPLPPDRHRYCTATATTTAARAATVTGTGPARARARVLPGLRLLPRRLQLPRLLQPSRLLQLPWLLQPPLPLQLPRLPATATATASPSALNTARATATATATAATTATATADGTAPCGAPFRIQRDPRRAGAGGAHAARWSRPPDARLSDAKGGRALPARHRARVRHRHGRLCSTSDYGLTRRRRRLRLRAMRFLTTFGGDALRPCPTAAAYGGTAVEGGSSRASLGLEGLRRSRVDGAIVEPRGPRAMDAIR